MNQNFTQIMVDVKKKYNNENLRRAPVRFPLAGAGGGSAKFLHGCGDERECRGKKLEIKERFE